MSDAVTKEQLESFGAKLDAFAASLPERERDILAHVLTSAAPETEGFAQHRRGGWGSFSGYAIFVIIGPQMYVPMGEGLSYFPNIERVDDDPSLL